MRHLFILLFSITLFGQNIPVDSISYDFFYKKEMQTIVRLKKEGENKKFDALKKIKIAELYANINMEDSAYATYYKVFEKEKINKTINDEQYKELLFQLHRTESSKHNYEKDRRFFLKELQLASENDASDKWFSKINYENFKDIYADSLKYEMALAKIKTIQNTNFYKTNDEFRAITLLGLGNLYTTLLQYELSEKALNESLRLARKNNDFLHQIYTLINLGVNERMRGNYEKALKFIDNAEAIPNKKYQIKIARIIAFQKLLNYLNLKDTVAAKKQKIAYNKLEGLINDFAKNSNFYEIDVRFQTKEKDARISKLNDLESRFVRNKILYGILIFVVFLLALYSFLRWKKVDKAKQLLALEKIKAEQVTLETQKELKTVKKKSVTEHITLKNKAIVQLENLLYIRADDHYLELITNTKKEITRGSLKEITEQLPGHINFLGIRQKVFPF
jgi:hypothetical protein